MCFRMKGAHKIVREITMDKAKLQEIAKVLGADPNKLQAADIELIYEEGTGEDKGAGQKGNSP